MLHGAVMALQEPFFKLQLAAAHSLGIICVILPKKQQQFLIV